MSIPSMRDVMDGDSAGGVTSTVQPVVLCMCNCDVKKRPRGRTESVRIDHGVVGVEFQLASAVEHRPADVVPQPLIVQDELANRLRKLLTLPLALSPCRGIALALLHGGTR